MMRTDIRASLLTWQQAIDKAWEMAGDNGFRYRVWRDSLGGWNVSRAGRRKCRR
jgi:hypothetical protein